MLEEEGEERAVGEAKGEESGILLVILESIE